MLNKYERAIIIDTIVYLNNRDQGLKGNREKYSLELRKLLDQMVRGTLKENKQVLKEFDQKFKLDPSYLNPNRSKIK